MSTVTHDCSLASSKLGGLLVSGLEVTDHVEGGLGVLITSALEEGAEAFNGGGELDELARNTGEHLSDGEGLRKELLDLSGSCDGESILFGKLVHTENGDDILKGLVVLDELLDCTGDVVVLVTDDHGIEDTGGGLKRVDGGVDTELSERTRQHSVSIQMGEGGGGSGISQIICGHVHSLDGGDGAGLGGGDSLLKSTEIGSERRLITDSGGNTTEQGGHLGASLSEAEDVVDEEKHVLVLLISEVLSDSEAGKGDARSGTWRLVHLTVHQGATRASRVTINNLVHTRLHHLVVKIVALSGSLADTSEHGVTTVSLGDVVDELHDKHSLADTGTTEETNLTSLLIGSKQIDDLDT